MIYIAPKSEWTESGRKHNSSQQKAANKHFNGQFPGSIQLETSEDR